MNDMVKKGVKQYEKIEFIYNVYTIDFQYFCV